MVDHDVVYEMFGQTDIPSYLFNVDDVEGCNGIWAIAYTSSTLEDARSCGELLLSGILPEGIDAFNETTIEWMLSLRSSRQ